MSRQTVAPNRRYHLDLCEKGVYQAIFLDLLRSGYAIQKIDLTHSSTDTWATPAKTGSTGYDGYKKVNDGKLSALAYQSDIPLSCTISPANVHDSHLCALVLEAFAIPGTQEQPAIISAGAAYNTQEIRQYNWKQGIGINIPVNQGNWIHPKQGRPVRFNSELYKKRSAIERFSSWIEAFKKFTLWHERSEASFLGLIHLASAIMTPEGFGMSSHTKWRCKW